MTITFPRAMPTSGVARQKFEVARADFLSPLVGGNVGAIANGFPLWTAQWTVGQARSAADEWRAFIASLRGGQKLFLGRDFGRQYPLAYQTGVGVSWPGGFSGDASSWSVNSDRDVLTIGVPTGMIITANDYVGFRWTTSGAVRRALVRSLETVTASSGAAAFAIDPPLPTLVDAGATATLDKPDCLMRQVTDQTEIGEQDRRLAVAARLAGVQVLLP
jgi:hypothetical protein